MGSSSVFQWQRRSVIGALRKRLGAVRPEKGKVRGEARVEVGVLGAETRRWPVSFEREDVLWEMLAGWAGAEVVDLSYSMLLGGMRYVFEGAWGGCDGM